MPCRSRHVGVQVAGVWVPAETPRPLRCLVVHGRRRAGRAARVCPRHQLSDGWVSELASHREMVSSTRSCPPGLWLIRASLPAGPWELGALTAGQRSQGAAAVHGPPPCSVGPPGIPRPLWWRRVPCLGPVAWPVLGLQGALQTGEAGGRAQRRCGTEDSHRLCGIHLAISPPASPSEAEMPLAARLPRNEPPAAGTPGACRA